MEERARGNVTQYFINKQAYKIIFHHGKQNASDLDPSICNNARCSWAIGSTWNMLTHYQIFRNRILAVSAGPKIARVKRHPPFLPLILKSFRGSLKNFD